MQLSTENLQYIDLALQNNHLPAELRVLPKIESNYNPDAVSRTGARTIWQLMPQTIQRFGKFTAKYSNFANLLKKDSVNTSTDIAINYLKYLHKLFNGQTLQIVAAYNCGEGCVQKYLAGRRALPKETIAYIRKFKLEIQHGFR